ncbi:MAG: hypothetical protein PHF00_04735 [Elusimicrobia bacterium]|nr:hypothetical protein [Elusimicrobiota bacterium]
MTDGPRHGILFAAAEHGSANVVLPVLRACADREPTGWVGLIPAQERFLIVNRVARGPRGLSGLPWRRFDLCVTGSSASHGLERAIWRHCRADGIKSLCILDQHKDIAERFGPNRSRLWPDRICVMNVAARRELLRLGVPAKKIVVSGSPYLAAPPDSRISASQRLRLRKALGLKDRKMITFCTEYIAKAGQKARYGYDEHLVLSDLKRVLERTALDPVVYIRLHPNDSAGEYRRYLREARPGITFRLVHRDPGNQLLQASDLVIGMSSIILVEAARLGLPVISYQPDAGRRAFVFDEHMRRSLVRECAGLARKVRALLGHPSIMPPRRDHGSADPVKRILAAMSALRSHP